MKKTRPKFVEFRPKAAKATPVICKKYAKFTRKRWHKIFIAIFLLCFIPVGAIFTFEQIFSKRIYPGVQAGELKLGGKTKEEALAALNQIVKQFNEEGMNFIYQDKKVFLTPIIAATSDPDLSRAIFILETKKTVEEAFDLGRGGDFLDNLKDQFEFLFAGQKIKLQYQFDEQEIKKILRENFGYLEKPPQDAKLKFIFQNSAASLEVLPEMPGQVFDYQTAIQTAFAKVAELNGAPTSLNFILAQPKIKKAETILAEERAKKLVDLCQIILGEAKKTWSINQNQIRDWLEFQPTSSGPSIGFNKNKLTEYLQTIAQEINVRPQDAKFKIEGGVVKEFQIHQGGKELDANANYAVINNYILNLADDKIAAYCEKKQIPENIVHLIVKITAPQIPIGSINNLGIKELVGVGASNFAGSPQNRRHNIRTGAAKLNGTLIPPGEEFSLDRALGEVNGQTGYLPELVIKGSETVPEFGGGLCQIGTTMFRVALDAGLPVTERKSHSYRVVYYEPAGMDATIYNPKPDLKFINDTPSYLLLQTKIEGDELTFELWGTSDGRKTEISKPRVFNLVSPGPTKIVETEDLKPGEKKCTERAHTGADAEFSRTITFASGEIKTETWKSHYVPWAAVCLVGKIFTPPAEEALPTGETLPETASPPSDANINFPVF